MQSARIVILLELAGAVFMIAAGSALHFAFDWSGQWHPLALVAAVNESIWEHLKLAFWPGVLWGVYVWFFTAASWARIVAAKGISLAITSILIVGIFETYTNVLGNNLLVLDIGTFAFAVIVGQVLSALIMIAGPNSRLVLSGGLMPAAIQLAAFSTLTYHPHSSWLFFDNRNGQIGIPK